MTVVSERPDLTIKTTRSAAFHEYAQRYAPKGVLGGGRYWRPYPLCIAKALGSRLWDIDGNEYIDYHGSFGPSVLGQNVAEIREAVIDAMESKGILSLSLTRLRSNFASGSRSSSLPPRRSSSPARARRPLTTPSA